MDFWKKFFIWTLLAFFDYPEMFLKSFFEQIDCFFCFVLACLEFLSPHYIWHMWSKFDLYSQWTRNWIFVCDKFVNLSHKSLKTNLALQQWYRYHTNLIADEVIFKHLDDINKSFLHLTKSFFWMETFWNDFLTYLESSF